MKYVIETQYISTPDNLTAIDALPHTIPTKINPPPINVKSCRYPQKHKEEVDKQI